MYPDSLKLVNETIMPNFVKLHNAQSVDSEAQLKVTGLSKARSGMCTISAQSAQEVYIQNAALMLKHDIHHVFEFAISLPINWASENVQCDIAFNLWCREYSACSNRYIITYTSEWGPDFPVIQEYGGFNTDTGATSTYYHMKY
jgi:hypothetical protein